MTISVLPRAGEVEEELPHLDARLRVEAVGRLVEDERNRIVQERARDGHPLPHAVAQALDEQVLEAARAGHLQDLVDPLVARSTADAERGPEEVEVLADAHVVVGAERVGHVADEPLDLSRHRGAVDARDRGGAARRPGQTDEDLDRGGFARRRSGR